MNPIQSPVNAKLQLTSSNTAESASTQFNQAENNPLTSSNAATHLANQISTHLTAEQTNQLLRAPKLSPQSVGHFPDSLLRLTPAAENPAPTSPLSFDTYNTNPPKISKGASFNSLSMSDSNNASRS